MSYFCLFPVLKVRKMLSSIKFCDLSCISILGLPFVDSVQSEGRSSGDRITRAGIMPQIGKTDQEQDATDGSMLGVFTHITFWINKDMK